jgi:phage tail tube protein FII
MSIVSTISSRSNQFTASKDYQYSYPGEVDEIEENEQKDQEVLEESVNNAKEEKEEENEKQKEDDKTKRVSENFYIKENHNMKTIWENQKKESNGPISSRFY